MEQQPNTAYIEKSTLTDLLQKHGIPINTWGQGQAKTVDHLLEELNTGEAIIFEDPHSEKLVREFSFLAIVVLYENQDGLYQLEESKQVFTDGRTRTRRPDISVGEKLTQGDQDIVGATRRALEEELGIQGGFSITENGTTKEVVDSASYPGITSHRNRINVIAEISPSQYIPTGYIEHQPDKTTYFIWKKIN